MQPPRRWAAPAFLLLLIIVSLFAPTAAARAPEGLQFNPSIMNAPAADLDLDASGTFAGVVIEKSSTDTALERKDLHIFNLASTGTLYGTSSHDNFTAGFSQMVAVPHGGSSGADKFAVGGPDGTVHVFDRSGKDPRWYEELPSARTTDVAFTGNGDYVLASFLGLNESVASNPGRFAIYSDIGSPDGSPDATYVTSLDGRANAVAAPGGQNAEEVYAVGTEDYVRFYFNPRVHDSNFFETSTNEVSDLAFSDDGLYAVAGTQTDPKASVGVGVHLYARTTDASGNLEENFDSWFGDTEGSSVTAAAISADGRYFAAGTADGTMHFFENGGLEDETQHYGIPGPTWEQPDGNRIQDVAISGDGNIVVAASADKVYGFTKATGKLIWTVDLQGTVSSVDISNDGDRIAAIANVNGQGHVYGFRQVHDIDIATPDTLVTRPEEPVTGTVRITNNGSVPDRFSISVSQPSGWSASPELVERTILPGRTTTLNLTITPPPLKAPGTYETDIRVISQSGNQGATLAEVETEVLRDPDINITTPDTDLRLRANTEEVHAFQLANKGNSLAWINFTVEQGHSTARAWDVEVREYENRFSPYRLPSGATHTLTLSVKAPASASDGDYNRIRVIADGGDTQSVHNVTARVNPTFSLDASVDHPTIEAIPGGSNTTFLRVTNTGNSLDVVRINTTVRPENLQEHWDVLVPNQQRNLTLGPGETKTVPVTVRPSVEEPKAATVTLLLDSKGGFTEEVNIAVKRVQDNEDDGFLGIPGPGPAGIATALVLAALLTYRNRRPEDPPTW